MGDRRPGEDARTGARCQRLTRLTGKYGLGNGQGKTNGIDQVEGVAIHGTVRPGWRIDNRYHVTGQHTTLGIGQAQRLDRVERGTLCQRQQLAQRIVNRQ
ncbi:hypothetical protein D3C80_1875920 [compost metagenome]